ncbi:MAG: Rieske (2Fe-2S) protein [Myxococcota bacterium]
MAEKLPELLTRRGFFGFSVGAWLVSVAYPMLRYLTPLPLAGPGGPVRLTRAETTRVEKEKFAIVPVGRSRVLVFEDPSGELRALDARCTHEGCTVRYLARDALISCACHNARFDLDGRVVSGPPPRPLARYTAFRDDEGNITVSVATA